MSAAAEPTHRIETRPYKPETERAYVWATARASTAARLGGRWVHFPGVIRLVDAILETCVVTVATFETDQESILGYVAWGRDGSVEFLVLNKSLADDGRASPEERPPKGYRLHARKIAADVLRALLPADPITTMRRAPSPWVLDALILAGFNPEIVPAAV